jgi:hypothetical protein
MDEPTLYSFAPSFLLHDAPRAPRDATTAALEAWQPRDADFGASLPNHAWAQPGMALGPLVTDWQPLEPGDGGALRWGAMRAICQRASNSGRWCCPLERFVCATAAGRWHVGGWGDATADTLRVRVLLPLRRVTACNLTHVTVWASPRPASAAVYGAQFNGYDYADAVPKEGSVIVPSTPAGDDGTVTLPLPLEPLAPVASLFEPRIVAALRSHGCTARGLVDGLGTVLPDQRAVVEVCIPVDNDKERQYEVSVQVKGVVEFITSMPPATPRDAACVTRFRQVVLQ